MPLPIKPSTSQERKLLYTETLLNETDKVSVVTDESILIGHAAGVAKVSGKAEKDIALALGQLYPETSFGDQLDQVAQNNGIAPRFGAIGSTTYVRLSATPGTQYLSVTHQFRSTSGIRFVLDHDVTVPSFGFCYAKVHSVEVGSKSNVDPLTISIVSPQPAGHLNVINEYRADNGRDAESDEALRVRIKDGANILARGTLAMLEQVFISINNNVLKVYNQGRELSGKVVLAIATQNGADLSPTELDQLLDGAKDYFTLSDLRPFGTSFYGIRLVNITYGFVDIFFRCQLNASFDPDEIRKQIQVNISKYLDPRFFDPSKQKVEWDNLLEIVKNVPGVDYVLDQYFYPRQDIFFAGAIIPRLRGFLMLDVNGQIISDFQGVLSPQFYPNIIDSHYFATVVNPA